MFADEAKLIVLIKDLAFSGGSFAFGIEFADGIDRIQGIAYEYRLDEANLNLAKLLAEKPGFTIEFAQKKLFYLKRQEQIDLYLEGLRRAGVPEK